MPPEFADRITLALAGGVGCLSLVMARACVVFRGRRQSGTPLPLAYGTGHKYSASDVLGLRLSQLDEKVQFLFP
jgi:hypothetical protein